MEHWIQVLRHPRSPTHNVWAFWSVQRRSWWIDYGPRLLVHLIFWQWNLCHVLRHVGLQAGSARSHRLECKKKIYIYGYIYIWIYTFSPVLPVNHVCLYKDLLVRKPPQRFFSPSSPTFTSQLQGRPPEKNWSNPTKLLMNYTLGRLTAGTQSWRFGRSFSFLNGWLAGSMLIFHGVTNISRVSLFFLLNFHSFWFFFQSHNCYLLNIAVFFSHVSFKVKMATFFGMNRSSWWSTTWNNNSCWCSYKNAIRGTMTGPLLIRRSWGKNGNSKDGSDKGNARNKKHKKQKQQQ